MTDIVETVARAIKAKMDEQWGEATSDDPPEFDPKAIARAAIDAYEEAQAEADRAFLEGAQWSAEQTASIKAHAARREFNKFLATALNTRLIGSSHRQDGKDDD